MLAPGGHMVSEGIFVPPAGATGALVGLSGGVDSAVAALLLLQGGLRVEAVTFALWSDPACNRPNLCCSAESILAARATAQQLGIEHHLVDLADPFLREVVEPFVEEYARARTPNPCVRCNAYLRFPVLRSLADRRRLSHLATGHYARLSGNPPAAAPGDGGRQGPILRPGPGVAPCWPAACSRWAASARRRSGRWRCGGTAGAQPPREPGGVFHPRQRLPALPAHPG